jgi:hypothetical protein
MQKPVPPLGMSGSRAIQYISRRAALPASAWQSQFRNDILQSNSRLHPVNMKAPRLSTLAMRHSWWRNSPPTPETAPKIPRGPEAIRPFWPVSKKKKQVHVACAHVFQGSLLRLIEHRTCFVDRRHWNESPSDCRRGLADAGNSAERFDQGEPSPIQPAARHSCLDHLLFLHECNDLAQVVHDGFEFGDGFAGDAAAREPLAIFERFVFEPPHFELVAARLDLACA